MTEKKLGLEEVSRLLAGASQYRRCNRKKPGETGPGPGRWSDMPPPPLTPGKRLLYAILDFWDALVARKAFRKEAKKGNAKD